MGEFATGIFRHFVWIIATMAVDGQHWNDINNGWSEDKLGV